MTQETQVRGCPLCHIMLCHIMDLSMPAPTLREAFEHQDELFAPVFAILQQAVDQQSFPAASLSVTHQGSLVALKALGRFTYEAGAPSSSPRLLRRQGGDFDDQSATPAPAAPVRAP